MKITRGELQEIIHEQIQKGFRDVIGKAFEDSDMYKSFFKAGRNKLIPFNDDDSSNKAGFNKSYNQIFGKDKNEVLSDGGFDSLDEYFLAIKNRDFTPDSRLKDMAEGVGSEGGFLLPAEFERKVWDTNLEEEIVRPLAQVYGLKKGKGNSLTVPGTSDTDRSSFEVSGITSYWGAEAGSKTKTQPKLVQKVLKVNELYCYTETSDILIEDSAIPIDDLVGKLFYQNLRWRIDNAFLNGTGAGMPRGILGSSAIGTQSAESGQDASTIVWLNICGMLGKLMPGSFKRAVWVAEISCIPQLLNIGIQIGTAGSYVPVFTGGAKGYEILKRPVFLTEHLPTLGNQGCLVLADFSQYLILIKEGLRLETSKEFKFRNDQTVFRMVARVDGQPAVNSSLTLKSGTVVYAFVQLGDVA